jgi:hypothetical protein
MVRGAQWILRSGLHHFVTLYEVVDGHRGAASERGMPGVEMASKNPDPGTGPGEAQMVDGRDLEHLENRTQVSIEAVGGLGPTGGAASGGRGNRPWSIRSDDPKSLNRPDAEDPGEVPKAVGLALGHIHAEGLQPFAPFPHRNRKGARSQFRLGPLPSFF